MLRKTLLAASFAALFATGAMNVANGTSAALSDRGWISLTYKTTF